MRELRVLVVAVGCLLGREAFGQCRLIVETGSESPVIEPQQRVSYLVRRNVPVGMMCPGTIDPRTPMMGTPDASIRPDAGSKGVDAGAPDAGKDAPDAAPPDAMSIPDAAAPDPGPCDVRYGDTVTMTVQPEFSTGSDGARFVLLMVTPHTPQVTLEDPAFFQVLDALTRPMIVYDDVLVEDPALGYQCQDPKYPTYGQCNNGGGGGGGGGCGGGGWGDGDDPGSDPVPLDPDDYAPPVDAGLPDDTEILGPYEVGVLGTHDVAALAGWFDAHAYNYSQADLNAVDPYLQRGWNVVAVRVAATYAMDKVALPPLSFAWEGDTMTLPVALSNGPGAVGLPVRLYVKAEGRYEFPGAVVGYAQPAGAGFLTRSDMWTTPGGTLEGDPTAFRDVDDPTYREEQVVHREIHIPLSGNPPPPAGYDGGSNRSVCGCVLGSRNEGLSGVVILVVVGGVALRLGGRRGARRRNG